MRPHWEYSDSLKKNKEYPWPQMYPCSTNTCKLVLVSTIPFQTPKNLEDVVYLDLSAVHISQR